MRKPEIVWNRNVDTGFKVDFLTIPSTLVMLNVAFAIKPKSLHLISPPTLNRRCLLKFTPMENFPCLNFTQAISWLLVKHGPKALANKTVTYFVLNILVSAKKSFNWECVWDHVHGTFDFLVLGCRVIIQRLGVRSENTPLVAGFGCGRCVSYLDIDVSVLFQQKSIWFIEAKWRHVATQI